MSDLDDEPLEVEFSEAALRLQDYESETISIEGSLMVDPGVKLDRFEDEYSLFGSDWVNEFSLQYKGYSGDWQIPLLEDEESISGDISGKRIFLDSLTGEVKEYQVDDTKYLGLLIEDYELE